MQTREYQVPGFEAPVIVHRNEDWSGVMVIEWTDVLKGQHHVITIPAKILLWASMQETKETLLNEVRHALHRFEGGSLND
jgi:hypothetical protein